MTNNANRSIGQATSRPLSFSGTRGSQTYKGAFERFIIMTLVLLLPVISLTPGGPRNWNIATYAAFALFPIIWPKCRHLTIVRVYLLICVVALASAPVLAYFSLLNDPSRSFSIPNFYGYCSMLVNGLVTLCVVVAGVSLYSPVKTVIVYSCGMLVQAALFMDAPFEQVLKYNLLLPLTIILFACVTNSKSKILQISVVAASVILAVVADARINAAVPFFALVLVFWRGRANSKAVRPAVAAVSLLVVLVGLYTAGQASARDGLLGEKIQQRTVLQSGGQDLLMEARPEFGAALQLFQSQPLGFGAGVSPSAEDVYRASEGLSAIVPGILKGSYVQGFLFTDRIELHSVIWDLWVHFGLIGMGLGLGLFLYASRMLLLRLSEGGVKLLETTLLFYVLWFLLFGTISSNFMWVLMAVAVVVHSEGSKSADSGFASRQLSASGKHE